MDHPMLRHSEIERRRHHRRKRNMTAALGGAVLLFALVGIGITMYFLIGSVVRTAKNYAAPQETPKFYENYLNYVVGLDPQPFGSIKGANADWMLKTAAWATVTEDNNVGTYGITGDDSKIVPAADILKNYQKYFGNDVKPFYHTFSDNGITFTYDSKLQLFYIPQNAITYIFTPKVTNIDRNGNTVTLTVQYLPSTGWVHKADGTTTPPAASKTMIYVLNGGNGDYEITAIRNMPSAQSQPSSSPSSSSSSSSGSSSAAPAS
jgi:hypothetical protein